MEKIVELGRLYDFYGELLNDHQKEVYESYVYRDMSLAEIADEQGISRQAVHDLIKRCDKILADYENRLHLVERFEQVKTCVHRIKNLSETQEIELAFLKESMAAIKDMADEILDII